MKTRGNYERIDLESYECISVSLSEAEPPVYIPVDASLEFGGENFKKHFDYITRDEAKSSCHIPFRPEIWNNLPSNPDSKLPTTIDKTNKEPVSDEITKTKEVEARDPNKSKMTSPLPIPGGDPQDGSRRGYFFKESNPGSKSGSGRVGPSSSGLSPAGDDGGEHKMFFKMDL